MAKMIAIPLLDGRDVDPHFGQAKEFTMFEIEGNEARFVKMLRADGLQHQHEGLANMFKQSGVDVIVCGGVGRGMINGLQAAGLDIVSGASGNVVDVANSYAEGTLVSSGAVCQEHGNHVHTDWQH